MTSVLTFLLWSQIHTNRTREQFSRTIRREVSIETKSPSCGAKWMAGVTHVSLLVQTSRVIIFSPCFHQAVCLWECWSKSELWSVALVVVAILREMKWTAPLTEKNRSEVTCANFTVVLRVHCQDCNR